ncbi:hypothetical protein BM525_20785 (plasmid) [Alteromonas mediterranea]|uniref:Uncharacterized protein n=1 Tax=Alteromonas mediterranea TaxID=314275 RepID=A0AAC9JF98_9ALTE|nr:hypothetical protein [Alteromonas mediterranea]APD92301.1 hypothetical protein BM524_20560 [Alteromonas mediterranea]APE00162.1 hypothetical protein BM525_20785 [Alteromonas mediterranea]
MPVTYIVQQLNAIRTCFLKFCLLSGALMAAFSLSWSYTVLLLILILKVIILCFFLKVWNREFSKISNFEKDFQNRVSWSLDKHGWRIWWLKPVGAFLGAFVLTHMMLFTLLEAAVKI